MTIQERHEQINKILAKFKVLHEKYFPPARPLTDAEWAACVKDFFETADQWKGTNLEDLAGRISITFLDDLEQIHKAWEKRRGYEIQKAKQE